MPITYSDVSQKANGGTELLARELDKRLDPELMKEVQIIPSRVRELDESKIRILWLHDLPEDPESKHLSNGGWKKFHKLVFVSNWQMQAYVSVHKIPWSHCVVIKNAINPLPASPLFPGEGEPVRLIYHTTPHRGLQLLSPIFDKLCEDFGDRVHLDVFSSFGLYGWNERDEPYRELFAKLEANPRVTNRGAVPYEDVRAAVSSSHAFVYPSIWMETSCLCLMEAMSAGLVCVHPNFGGLFETASGFTHEYQWTENYSAHASLCYEVTKQAVQRILDKDEELAALRSYQKNFADGMYSWESRIHQWNALCHSLLDQPRPIPRAEFIYNPRI